MVPWTGCACPRGQDVSRARQRTGQPMPVRICICCCTRMQRYVLLHVPGQRSPPVGGAASIAVCKRRLDSQVSWKNGRLLYLLCLYRYRCLGARVDRRGQYFGTLRQRFCERFRHAWRVLGCWRLPFRNLQRVIEDTATSKIATKVCRYNRLRSRKTVHTHPPEWQFEGKKNRPSRPIFLSAVSATLPAKQIPCREFPRPSRHLRCGDSSAHRRLALRCKSR